MTDSEQASIAAGQPFGGGESDLVRRPGSVTSLVDANLNQGQATGQSGASGENPVVGQEARQGGDAVRPEDSDAARRKIDEQAGEGAAADPNGDGARKALEQIAQVSEETLNEAQRAAIQELLLTLFAGAGSPITERAEQKIVDALIQRVSDVSSPEQREGNIQRFEKTAREFVENFTKEKHQQLLEIIDKLKASPDDTISALGYDLDLFLTQKKISQIDQMIQQYEELAQNKDISDEDKVKIEAEKKRLAEEKEKLEEERKRIEKERNGEIEIPQDANEEKKQKIQAENERGERRKEIPNQVETRLKPLAQKVARAAGLTEKQQRDLSDNPLSLMAVSFEQGMGECIEMNEKKMIFSVNQEKFNQFIGSLEEALKGDGISVDSFSAEFNNLVNSLNNLSEDEKGLLKEIFVERVKDKGIQVGLGLAGILALLAYMAAKAESGGGGGRG